MCVTLGARASFAAASIGLLLQLVLVELSLDAAVRADGRVRDEIPDHLRKLVKKNEETNREHRCFGGVFSLCAAV